MKAVKERNYADEAKVFKAFCDENRLKILDMISEGELCACELLEELEVAQSTLSHHMKILVDSGIVNSRKEGKWAHYSINEKKAKEAKTLLDLVIAYQKTGKTKTSKNGEGDRCK